MEQSRESGTDGKSRRCLSHGAFESQDTEEEIVGGPGVGSPAWSMGTPGDHGRLCQRLLAVYMGIYGACHRRDSGFPRLLGTRNGAHKPCTSEGLSWDLVSVLQAHT